MVLDLRLNEKVGLSGDNLLFLYNFSYFLTPFLIFILYFQYFFVSLHGETNFAVHRAVLFG